MKHVRPVGKPAKAIDISDLPVDIEFIIDLLTSIIIKKEDLTT